MNDPLATAFVRIRPHLAEEDARALEALDRLVHELADAFDRFRDATSRTEPAAIQPVREETA